MTFTQLKEPLFYLSLAGVLITLPFPEHDINSKAIIFSVVCWLIYNPFSEKLSLIKKNIYPFFIISGLFFINCLGMIYTENTEEGVKILTRNLPFFIFPLIFSTINLEKKAIYFLLKYFSFSVIFAAVFALGKAIYLKINNLGDYFHFLKLEMLQDKHNTYFALFCVIAIAYFLFNLKRKTWWYLGCIIFLLGYIYLLSVRVSIVALLVVGIVYLISQRRRIPSKYFYLTFLCCALIPVIFYISPSFQEKFNPISPKGEAISDVDSRKTHWLAALDQAGRNNILMGEGTGDGHDGLYETYKKFGFETGFAEKYNAHNQYIETLLYFGLIGLMMLVGILLYVLQKNWIQRNYMGLTFIIVFSVFMLTESILQRHDGIVIFAFFISLFSVTKLIRKDAKKIVLIGPYTAIGGVSIHIKRLADLLRNDFDFSFIDESPVGQEKERVFHLRSGNPFKYFSIIWNSDVVHIHTSIWWLRGIHIFIGFIFRKKIIVSFHALLELKDSPNISLIQKYTTLADKVIVVNDEMFDILKIKNAIVKDAFILPNLNSEAEVPTELQKILEDNSDKKIIVSNAFRLDLHNNEDLYGLDLMVEVAKLIKLKNKPYKIIFVVASTEDKFGLLHKNKSVIKQEDLSEQITIFNHPISFVKLIQKSDLVIRSTNTDGDALTIREAMFLEKPIIASDIVQRPEGTILFRNRNAKDLFDKIDCCLCSETLKKQKKINENTDQEFYFNVY